MFKILVFLALVSFGFGVRRHIGFQADQWILRQFSPQERIVNGANATKGEFPYQISLRAVPYPSHFCGGSILSENVVLTAAHCVREHLIPPNSLTEVVAGRYELDKDGPHVQISKIKKAIKHPKYSEQHYPYDIGIIILESPFKFNKFVQPIALPEKDAEFTGKTMLSGWGSTSNTSHPSYPNVLQKVELPLIDTKKCNESFKDKEVYDFCNICTGPIGGNVSACSGDSGGPLTKVVNGVVTVIGIVSWGGIPCGRGSPSVYTRVSKFIEFIKDNLLN